jgi:hypothetical protein
MVPKWKCACPARRLDVIIVNPGSMDPDFRIKEVANLLKKVSGGLSYYTLGTTGFISVTDVVSIIMS